MKTSILFIVLLAFIGLSVNAQNWAWERVSNGTNNVHEVYTFGTTTDFAGNVYITGKFLSSNLKLGNLTLYNHDTLTSLMSDMFLAKYDPNGNVIWAVSAGGDDNDCGNAVTTDAQGNVIITGRFRSKYLAFGTDTLWNARHWMFDCFIVKYDSNGNYLWAKRAGGGDDENGLAVSTDHVGNVYVGGTFKSNTINFGNYTYANADSGYDDIFLVKMAPNGTVLRLNHYGNYGAEEVQSMAIDANNNIYITGLFNSQTLAFGNITLTLGANSMTDMFIAKMDTNANFLWAFNAGGGNMNAGMGVCIDNSGNAYVTGYFRGPSITFGSTVLTNTVNGATDVFVVKYKYNGIVLWAKSAGGGSHDSGFGCATDGTNVYVTGFSYSPTFTFGNDTLQNGGDADIFVLEYDQSGNPVFAKSARGIYADNGMCIAVDHNSNIYIAGQFFSQTLIFDNDTLTGPLVYKMFLAKLSPITTDIQATEIIPQIGIIYPNPNNGTFTLNYHPAAIGIPNNAPIKLELKDVFGRTVFTYPIHESATLMPNSEIPITVPLNNGIYFWELIAADEFSHPNPILANGKLVLMK